MVSIAYNSSFLTAIAIANLFLSENQNTPGDDYISISAYQNGREQGVCIHNMRSNVSAYIAIFRRSDQIVVYTGQGACNQGITDDHYKNARYFSTASVALEFINSVIIRKT